MAVPVAEIQVAAADFRVNDQYAVGAAVGNGIFRGLDALRVFDLIYVLTPNSADTMSMSVYARQQLVDFQDVGYGSAASTLLFFTVALCTTLFLMLVRTRPDGRIGP